MYVAQENQLLYPASWEYNTARVVTELAKVISNAGGSVKPSRKARLINRTVLDMRRTYEQNITHLESLSENSIRENALTSYRRKLAALENVNTDPIMVTHTNWIHFVLDGYVYYYEINENPFFDFHYSKIPLQNGKYSLDIYSDSDKKKWLYDCFLRCDCSDSDVREAAHSIFDMLIRARPSAVYRKTNNVMVPNTYDNGYHYENVPVAERTAKVDW